MKSRFFLILLAFWSCETKKTETTQPPAKQTAIPGNPKKEKQIDWQEGFGLTHDTDKDSIAGKPMRYYTENKDCNPTAIAFYFGKYRPVDEPKTEQLLNLVTTDNAELRPFYRWVLDKTIEIQDGALGEYTGQPARRYAEKFPKEFLDFIDADKPGEKYTNWADCIGYSGFYQADDYEKPIVVRQAMIKTMSQNCKDCNEAALAKWAKDCFPDTNRF